MKTAFLNGCKGERDVCFDRDRAAIAAAAEEEDFPGFCALVMDRERSRSMGTDYIRDEAAARALFDRR